MELSGQHVKTNETVLRRLSALQYLLSRSISLSGEAFKVFPLGLDWLGELLNDTGREQRVTAQVINTQVMKERG